jgi:hypothetical protein
MKTQPFSSLFVFYLPLLKLITKKLSYKYTGVPPFQVTPIDLI